MSASRLALPLLLVSALLGACDAGTPGGTEPATVSSVTVSAPAEEVNVGATLQLAATARDASGSIVSDRTFQWTTSSATRATVSATGLVTGLSAGAVTITVATDGRSGSVALDITDVPVASVTVVPDTATRDVDSALQMRAVLLDATGDTLAGRSIAWTSSDTSSVRISPTGLATFIAGGSSVITAESEGVSGTATLTSIAPAPVARVAVSPDSVTLDVDGTQQLTASLYDEADVALTGRTVTWSTNASAVATVSDAGLVTAAEVGTAWIVAESEGVRDSAHVSVALDMPETGGAIAAGFYLSCALTVDGDAWCWGRYDLLGDPDVPIGDSQPRKVVGGHKFVAIDVGSHNALALTADGVAYTWGRVPNGLQPVHGQGYEIDQLYEPTPVSGGLRFAAISAGSGHSCGITPDGDAYCWGGIHFGTIGDGTQAWRNAPTLVAGGHKFSRISAGEGHTVALTSDGVAWAWGVNNNGELGDSTGGAPSDVPVKVVGGHTFVDVSAGYGTAALTADGSVYEWGGNAPDYPTQLPGHTFAKVIAGPAHNLALTADGELWAWGFNEGLPGSAGPGALGDGTMITSWTPVRVSGGRTYRDASAGRLYSVALGTDGNAYGWGDNRAQAAIGGYHDGYLLEPVGPVDPRLQMTVSPTEVEVVPGSSSAVTVTINRITGGFTILGPRLAGDITLEPTTELAGVTMSLSPATLPAGVASSTLSISAAGEAPPASGTVMVAASAANTASTQNGSYVTVVEPPPPPVEGEEYACPTGSTPLPDGYHCMTAGTSHTAGKFSDVELHGTWVDADAEVCLTWDATGKQGFARYHANGSVTESAKGEWGAMINTDGTRYPNEQYWNIYTETADPQTQLLTYDSASKTIVNWGFVKGTCPF